MVSYVSFFYQIKLVNKLREQRPTISWNKFSFVEEYASVLDELMWEASTPIKNFLDSVSPLPGLFVPKYIKTSNED